MIFSTVAAITPAVVLDSNQSIVEPAAREEFLALMLETYGTAMSPAEFDWWFDSNPAGPRILNGARDAEGAMLGALGMSLAHMSQGIAAFAVHAVTTPAARGRGVFSSLELHNEQQAALSGASWALGFTNPMAGPILVGKLGWEDLTALRIWVRPKGLRARATGGGLYQTGVERFTESMQLPAHHIVRSPEYLNWRYCESPRPYLRIDDDHGFAVVAHAVWHGFSSLVICEATPSARLLRRCARAGAADIVVAMVNPGEERIYMTAGFVPTPRTIRFIGKRLGQDAPELPKRRDAWHFTLGDLDFF